MATERQVTIQQFREHLRQARIPRPIEEIIISHTWRPDTKGYRGIDSVRELRRDDMSIRGWSDNGCHLMIGPDGAIFLCRPLARTGVLVPGRNAHTVTVKFIGNFDHETPEDFPAAFDSAARVCAALIHHCDLTPRAVRFEREFQRTGPGLKVSLLEFRSAVEAALQDLSLTASGRDVLDRLTSEKTLLADLLLDAVHQRIRSISSQEVIDNLEAGLNRLLGRRGQMLCKAHPAREWLDTALRELGMDFADEFAEAVAQAADEVCQEADARQAEIVAREAAGRRPEHERQSAV